MFMKNNIPSFKRYVVISITTILANVFLYEIFILLQGRKPRFNEFSHVIVFVSIIINYIFLNYQSK